MAGLNDDAQWIVMMGFVVSFSLFFLAMILNQSTVVGQTTAESVLDFPKNDIRDVKSVIIESAATGDGDPGNVLYDDITNIALGRKGAVVNYIVTCTKLTRSHTSHIHYNNGVTDIMKTGHHPEHHQEAGVTTTDRVRDRDHYPSDSFCCRAPAGKRKFHAGAGRNTGVQYIYGYRERGLDADCGCVQHCTGKRDTSPVI